MRKNIWAFLMLLPFLFTGCGAGNTYQPSENGLHVNKPPHFEVITGTEITDDENLPVRLGITENTPQEYVANYKPVAKSKKQLLYVDMEKGWFALKDLESGHIWYSNPNNILTDQTTKGKRRQETRSDLVISYIFKKDEASAQSLMTANSHTECVRAKTVEVTEIEGGVRVAYNFSKFGILIPLELKLFDDFFEVRLDTEGVKTGTAYKADQKKQGVDQETLDAVEECILVDVAVFPMFGAGSEKEEGYVFVPDGSGAIIDFSPFPLSQNSYSALVYGEELALILQGNSTKMQAVRLPVFGTVKPDAALMAVIAEGDGAASIQAIKNNAECLYTAVGSIANLKLHSRTFLYESYYDLRSQIMKISKDNHAVKSFAVRYYTLSGEQASYGGMAEKYREFLEKEWGMAAAKPEIALMLNIYGSAEVGASIVGIPYKRQQSLTTFKQAEKMVDELLSMGIEKLAVKYIGWTNSGILNNKVLNSADPLSNLGGAIGYKNLAAALEEKNIAFYPQVDFVKYKASGRGISKNRDSAKTLFGEAALQYDFIPSVFVKKLGVEPIRFVSPQRLPMLSDRFFASYQALGTKGIAFETIGETIYSSLAPENEFYRSLLPGVYAEILEQYRENGYSIVVDGGNAYAAAAADTIFSPPVNSSGYDLFARDVPFYAMVFRGVKNLTGESVQRGVSPEISFLKSVETGSMLLFDGMYEDSSILSYTRFNNLYGTQYKLWAEKAKNMYERYYGLLNEIGSSTIKKHEMLSPGVYKTTYSNGISVIVNYNDTPYENVGAKSFLKIA